ncbi:DUF1028 domain-containing protein [Truepera radiovictrix]|uniref:Putative peptidoglycan binding domain-containing protein n=1 Tax=Truepera radiovictrix (strain DSM 17093 / CIP 108686 / LMG 22925 / RQ-24) TaxID=649638 RepID=D7CQ27_TRURR|nr:DUF1028 domain-containing protein [Truepera radiovictrix]ADI14811.1 protein of unknown function DUF1028 [Truepera radiovictrix DSM 17093]WMT56638.1 DUF1028 domain-containing protein [Truepera radiovictrix]
MRSVSTFSIVARDPETGDLGVATASKFLAVGAVVPYAEAGVGAVATQSYANTTFGPRTIMALRGGISLELIHQAFAETDPQHAQRQYGLVDAHGHSFTFTGDACHPWAGGQCGENYAAQGNLLTGPEVIGALVTTFQETTGPLAERLVAALAAGDAAGGDKRGRQSAALLVVRQEGGYGGFNDRYLDLRVDDHAHPVEELRRLLGLHRLLFERPKPEALLEIDAALAKRVQEGLVRAGYLERAAETWDERAEAALQAFAGVENLEERLVEPGRIDPEVLAHLERVAR